MPNTDTTLHTGKDYHVVLTDWKEKKHEFDMKGNSPVEVSRTAQEYLWMESHEFDRHPPISILVVLK